MKALTERLCYLTASDAFKAQSGLSITWLIPRSISFWPCTLTISPLPPCVHLCEGCAILRPTPDQLLWIGTGNLNPQIVYTTCHSPLHPEYIGNAGIGEQIKYEFKFHLATL